LLLFLRISRRFLSWISFGEFRVVDGFEPNGECNECERRGLPVIVVSERYFGDGSIGRTETATICERCLATYASHAAEALEHELKLCLRGERNT